MTPNRVKLELVVNKIMTSISKEITNILFPVSFITAECKELNSL